MVGACSNRKWELCEQTVLHGWDLGIEIVHALLIIQWCSVCHRLSSLVNMVYVTHATSVFPCDEEEQLVCIMRAVTMKWCTFSANHY